MLALNLIGKKFFMCIEGEEWEKSGQEASFKM